MSKKNVGETSGETSDEITDEKTDETTDDTGDLLEDCPNAPAAPPGGATEPTGATEPSEATGSTGTNGPGGAGSDRVCTAFEAAEDIDPDPTGSAVAPDVPDPAGDKPPEPDSAPIIESGDGSSVLPARFPVLPLGQAAGKFYFLTARGEMADLSAAAMSNRANLVALVSGAADALDWLDAIAPVKSARDAGFNTAVAADVLMAACSVLPLFDLHMPIRHCGTWRGSGRGSGAVPIAHLGEDLLCSDSEERHGRMLGRALYPAVPSRPAPAATGCPAEELIWIGERIRRYWSWGSATDALVVMGWIGQAALGQYPQWRTHLWIKGKHGSGKSTLLRILSALLGGMSSGVRKSTSAAAVRQTTNRMAIARIFDEAETDGTGRMEEVISLFRLMSDADGAQVERGTSDHTGIRFELYGAGLMASIIPGVMTPADRSRFVVLDLGKTPDTGSPEDAAMRIEELESDAKDLGAAVWRRMLDLAPKRWDSTFRIYSSIVQGLGAGARTGDTVGALLAGWDLMLHDAPLADPVNGALDQARIDLAKQIAQPLIAAALEAEAEGEGERCLRSIFAAYLPKDHGGVISVAEVIERLVTGAGNPNPYDTALIGRIGLRVMPGEEGKRDLFIANGQHPQLDKALLGTRWRGGGHRAALDTLDGIKPSPRPVRVAGSNIRGLIVPNRYLPGGEEGGQEVGGEEGEDGGENGKKSREEGNGLK